MKRMFKVKGPVLGWSTKAILTDDPTTRHELAVEIWDEENSDKDNKLPPCLNSANRLRALSDYLLKAADIIESRGQK